MAIKIAGDAVIDNSKNVVNVAGGTFSGKVTSQETSSSDSDTTLATKGYVDGKDAGKILQVKQTWVDTTSSQALTGSSRVNLTGLTLTITPLSSTSNMLITVRWTGESTTTNFENNVFGIRRNGTDIGNPASDGIRPAGMACPSFGFWNDNADTTPDNAVYQYLDTSRSSGTSAITYTASIMSIINQTLYNNRTRTDGNNLESERLTSSIIVMEVAS